MAAAFADAFHFIALLDSTDRCHARSVAWSRQKSVSLVTTEYVLLALAGALHTPSLREGFAVFHDSLRDDSKFRILASSTTLFAKGMNLYRRRRQQPNRAPCPPFRGSKRQQRSNSGR